MEKHAHNIIVSIYRYNYTLIGGGGVGEGDGEGEDGTFYYILASIQMVSVLILNVTSAIIAISGLLSTV